ncbi:mucoidy inhibitor MuiA family protein [Falsiphaeobacter marinintestinus]|uniref:mucoidy inhibitor MuiA family protein n=1 Tax=Falsiphaeobacter marinintestinus TaxID=1492905 RepID=UPI0011B83C55|nr:mucoidy inhibitor MuiA family protein [Phaeobacter marinintestinus]
MRSPLCLLFCLPMAAWADDFVLSSTVTDVTLYPEGAALTRKAEFSVPQGTHRLVLRDLPQVDDPLSIRVRVDGARSGPVTFRQSYAPPEGLPDRADVVAAKDRVAQIESQIETVQDNVRRARAEGDAARMQLEFLGRLGSGESITSAAPEALSEVSDLVARGALSANEIIIQSDIRAREAARDLKDLQVALALAQEALQAVSGDDRDRMAIIVDVTSDQPSTGAVTLSYLSDWGSRWMPVYDARLSTDGDPRVQLLRSALAMQNTGETWADIRLAMSTLEPSGQIEPRRLYPQRRRIEDPAPPRSLKSDAESYGALAAEPVVESPAIVAGTLLDGPGVTYVYPNPVTMASGSDFMKLGLDEVPLQAKTRAIAVPSRDDMAFLIATVKNTSAEHILASETSLQFVDGVFVGEWQMPAIPAGGEADIPFGPIQELRLSAINVEAGEGETGLFTKSNEQRKHRRLEIENLSSTETYDVRVLDNVPYSEQDDLVIDWQASPPPDEENVDDMHGVLAWDITVAPGETKVIDLRTQLSWPEDKVLK